MFFHVYIDYAFIFMYFCILIAELVTLLVCFCVVICGFRFLILVIHCKFMMCVCVCLLRFDFVFVLCICDSQLLNLVLLTGFLIWVLMV